MSKFDNLFNKPCFSATSLERKTNSFVSVSKPKDTKPKDTKPKNYNFIEDDYPDLTPSDLKPDIKPDIKVTKKYSDIALNKDESESENENDYKDEINNNSVLPGWTQYSVCKKTGAINVIHGSKTPRQIEQEAEDAAKALKAALKSAKRKNPLYNYRQMITTLEQNWSRYKKQYDEIHGEGAYELAHYCEPIYPEDDNLYEIEKGHDYEYDYVDDYEDQSKHKNYSVCGKQ